MPSDQLPSDQPMAGEDPTPDAADTSPTIPETALPPVYARVLAFLAILVGGACGGFIGYAFGSLGGFSDLATGFITLIVGLGFAAGVAVVAVLTLRALGEWETIREQGPEAIRAARAARAGRAKS